MAEIREDVKPAAFTGASTAIMGTIGGLMPAFVHSIIVTGGPFSFVGMLASDVAVVAAIGAGQGLVAAVTALSRGKGEHYISPRRGLLGALGVGAFNGLMYFVQMAVPATELGWGPDLFLLAGAGAAAGWLAVRVKAREPVINLP